MAEYTMRDAATVDPREVLEHLLDDGWTQILVQPIADTLLVVVFDAATTEVISQSLADFVPTAARGAYRPPLLPALRQHAGHLRDFRDAVRNGNPVTNAQTLHVMADIIDWIRLTEDRL